MTPNVSLLRKTLEHIEAHPEEWNQEDWRCESGMCFAGWAATLHGADWAYDADDYSFRRIDCKYPLRSEDGADAREIVIDEDAALLPVRVYAQRALNLSAKEARRLFSGGNGFSDLRRIVAELCVGAS